MCFVFVLTYVLRVPCLYRAFPFLSRDSDTVIHMYSRLKKNLIQTNKNHRFYNTNAYARQYRSISANLYQSVPIIMNVLVCIEHEHYALNTYHTYLVSTKASNTDQVCPILTNPNRYIPICNNKS